MRSSPEAADHSPVHIWRWARRAFVVLVLGVTAVAIWISVGGADPPRAGPLRWRDPLTAEGGWRIEAGRVTWTPAGASLQPVEGRPAVLVTDAPQQAYTLEIAAQPGSGDTRYGLTVDWSTRSAFIALVNGNGFAQVSTLSGAGQRDAFRLAQWPWIRPGTGLNRIRVDVTTARIDVRVNGEFLVSAARGAAAPTLGLWADGPVVFREAALWTE